MEHADVVVVGAGPVGLLLASEIALGGGRVVVLERLDTPNATIKAGSINLASVELLARRGLLDELRAESERTMHSLAAGGGSADDGRNLRTRLSRAGHFAGMWLDVDQIDADDPRLTGHREALGATLVPQAAIESLLARHAVCLGVEVRRGVTVTGILDRDDDVVVETGFGSLTAGHVVGCDGGRSVVRHSTGIEFVGSPPEITGHQAVADLDDDAPLSRGWNWSTRGVYCYGPQPGRILTVEFDGPPADRDSPVTAEELQASIRRVSGTQVVVRGMHGAATRWTDNARQAADYRRGRVLLAGDAAHVHSPFSGQGLNLGLGDAMNLGWKLAAVSTGRAEPELLATYQAERHPAGAWVLDWTRAQVALLRPDPKNAPLRQAFSELIATRDGATLTAARISGVARRVDLGVGHPMIGSLVGDVECTDGRMLREHFVDGEFVLATTGLPESIPRRAARRAPVRVRCAPVPSGVPTMLARPDGVIAWATENPTPSVDELEEVLRRSGCRV